MSNNKEYCAPINFGKAIEYAPVFIPPSVLTPSEEVYNANGWFKNAIKPPSPPEGKIVSSTHYEVVDNKVIATYQYSDPPKPVLSDYDSAMESHLHQERIERGYTTREPDSYLTSSVPRWAQDAKDWVSHRDEVMEYALDLINAVEQGLKEPPTLEEFKEGLPCITWSYQE